MLKRLVLAALAAVVLFPALANADFDREWGTGKPAWDGYDVTWEPHIYTSLSAAEEWAGGEPCTPRDHGFCSSYKGHLGRRYPQACPSVRGSQPIRVKVIPSIGGDSHGGYAPVGRGAPDGRGCTIYIGSGTWEAVRFRVSFRWLLRPEPCGLLIHELWHLITRRGDHPLGPPGWTGSPGLFNPYENPWGECRWRVPGWKKYVHARAQRRHG